MNRYSLLHSLGQLQRRSLRAEFEKAVHAPEAAQASRLKIIVERSRETVFGKEHKLGQVRNLADLQARVPVQTDQTLRSWIAREMAGERHVMCGEKPIFYALSSGTTGTPKHMPSTESFLKEFQLALTTSTAYNYDRYREAFTGTLFYYVAKKEVARSEDGTPIGYTSGFNFSRMPKLIRSVYAVPYEAFEVRDDRARAYLMAWFCVRSPITIIGAIFPLALTEMLRRVEGEADALVRDLRSGTLRDDLPFTAEERAFFTPFARVDRNAADRVESESKEFGKLHGRSIFSKAKLLYCWTSASAGLYVPAARDALPEGIAIADGVYAANEGWSNVPVADGTLGGPVSINGHFYEFVEEDAWENGVREGVGVEGLRDGARYRMLLTTSAGMFRYDLGDIVECNGMYQRTPRIRFARRAGAAHSMSGERLEESQVQQAVIKTGAALGLEPVFFCAVPRNGLPPRWELVVEFPAKVPAEKLEAWRAALEIALGKENMEYEDFAGTSLEPVALRVLRPGAFEKHRRAQLEAGSPGAQSKVVNLDARCEAHAHLGPFDLIEGARRL